MTSPIALSALLLIVFLTAGPTAPAFAQGDPVHGATVFKKCVACHEAERARNKMGPHLQAVFGRSAGSIPDYRYSQAMKDAGLSGLIWDETNLSKFLSSPKKLVPGTSMRFFGLMRSSDVDDVIAYLKQLENARKID